MLIHTFFTVESASTETIKKAIQCSINLGNAQSFEDCEEFLSLRFDWLIESRRDDFIAVWKDLHTIAESSNSQLENVVDEVWRQHLFFF